MSKKNFTFKGKVFIYPGAGGWHFVTLPKKESEQIGKTKTIRKGAWGFIKAKVTVGKSAWFTGLWPKKDEGVYLLVIKAPIRKKEGIFEGDIIRAIVSI